MNCKNLPRRQQEHGDTRGLSGFLRDPVTLWFKKSATQWPNDEVNVERSDATEA